MRSLNLFILDDMIEQFERLNPVPEDRGKRNSVDDTLHAELLAGYLVELKALRTRASLYEIKIQHMERELKQQDNVIIELQLLIDQKGDRGE